MIGRSLAPLSITQSIDQSAQISGIPATRFCSSMWSEKLLRDGKTERGEKRSEYAG